MFILWPDYNHRGFRSFQLFAGEFQLSVAGISKAFGVCRVLAQDIECPAGEDSQNYACNRLNSSQGIRHDRGTQKPIKQVLNHVAELIKGRALPFTAWATGSAATEVSAPSKQPPQPTRSHAPTAE